MSRRFLSDRAADGLAFVFLAASVLVLVWFLLVAVSPDGPWNPLPPIDAEADAVQAAAGNRRAVASATWPPTWTPTPTGTHTSTPTITPTPTQTPTRRPPTPTNTPNPRLPYYISRLRKRTFKGGRVRLADEIPQSEAYTAHYIAYPSGDLTITGYMYVPLGDGPFPVVILNHGFYDPEFYFTGTGTQRAADYLAREGYLTVAPDYRNYGGSSAGESLMLVGYVEDVLNLVASLDSIDEADPSRVGLWGHSMGGGVSIKAAVVSDAIDAVALFGSVAADEEDNYYWNGVTRSKVLGVFGTPEQSPGPYAWASPINYLDFAPPMSIHHGEADTEVPIRFSETLYAAMRAAGRTVEYFTYPGQEHTFQGEGWDLAMERALTFFDQHLK